MNHQQKIDKLAAALRDCVKLFSGELDGLKVIQPELRQAEQALDCLDLVDAEMPFDWSKAPAGTTHRRIDDFRFPWRMLSKGLWHSWHDGWMVVTSADPDLYVARPSLEWSGEGLPPVGAVCELRCKIGGWGEAEIKYQGRAICVWLWIRRDGNTDQVEWAENPERMEFRPLRTPEQIAAEEREKAVSEMTIIALAGDNDLINKAWLDRLYDAGYRKQVAE